MATKFKLIPSIHTTQKAALTEAQQIIEGFTSVGVMIENVTHVLANISNKAANGEEISLASQDSIAAFLAGVEVVADRLPQSTADDNKTQSLVRTLNQCGVESDGTINTSCVPVAEIGAKFPDVRKKYYRLLALYNMSLERGRGVANDSLTRAVKVLQHRIDSAMRTTMVNRPQRREPLAATAPSMGGTPPAH